MCVSQDFTCCSLNWPLLPKRERWFLCGRGWEFQLHLVFMYNQGSRQLSSNLLRWIAFVSVEVWRYTFTESTLSPQPSVYTDAQDSLAAVVLAPELTYLLYKIPLLSQLEFQGDNKFKACRWKPNSEPSSHSIIFTFRVLTHLREEYKFSQ